MRFVKWLAGLVLMAIIGAYGFLRVNPPELLQVGTGYSAKMICSNVFLAGRDAQEVLKLDVQAPGHPLLKLVGVTVDESAGEVRTALWGGIAPSLAVFRNGYGCTLVPGGNRASLAELPEPAEATPAYVWPEAPDSRLDAVLADEALAGPGMRAIVVVRNGAIIAERYADGFSSETPLLGWSMTKTVTAMLAGQAVAKGALQLDQRDLFADWLNDGRKDISFADLLAMQSGLAWNEGYGDVSDVTRMLFLTANMKALPEAQMPVAAPGEAFLYSSGTSALVSQLVEQANGIGAQALPRAELFNPLGMASAVIEPDTTGTLVGSSYMYATARDWARLGQLMIGGGVAGGKVLLPSGWTQMMMTPTQASNSRYGQGHIWMDDVDDTGQPNGLPKGSVRFSGHDGQSVTVVPSHRLVIVRLGLTPSRLGWEPQPLTKALLAALE